ncbi:MAG: metallophosphoesterase family protein [Defluviitaleaceae bacterium]|nr:metallophosphoesterase family protein [Defluviitaleaceae bacterium]
MQKIKNISALFLSFVIVIGLLSTAAFAAPSTDPWKSPQQVVTAMTENPQNEMVITWTTIDLTLTDAKVEVTPVNGGETLTFTAVKTNRGVSNSSMRLENGGSVTQKAFYVAKLTGLSPNTAYNYICSAVDSEGVSHESVGNNFKTAPDAKDVFSFIYLSDTQTSGTNGKAMTVNSTFWANYDPGFVYIAGDLTDTAANEGQWETFFNQKTPNQDNTTQMTNNYDSAISDYALAAVQGNHDNNTFSNHINYAASGGTNITYAYTYGSARFIMLNFENTATRAEQQAFLREQVADAKENGFWTVVGFHKSIFSGASHMTDSDATDARRYWAPIFAELDVDVVLQGHDHVLSRGFVDANGNNARSTQDINYQKIGDRTYTAEKPSNAPLYYVGNCASTLKFYSATAGNAALAAPDYGFLDINSARDAGHTQNPDGPRSLDSSDAKLTYPTYTSVTVTADAITFETYFFQYDSVTDLIVTQPFLYDSFTVTRALPVWAEYNAAVTDAEDFIAGDFDIYEDESVELSKEIVANALVENALAFSYQEKQNIIDNAAMSVRSAIQEAKDALVVRFISAAPTSSVNKLNGNKNELTIIVTELFADGFVNTITATLTINNNTAGIYEVGGYKVYVDTKGNDQIRACYIVE